METPFIEDKFELMELVNKLFMYTDRYQWEQLLEEVFTDNVWFDMSSAGGGSPRTLSAEAICDMWQAGFTGLDAVHHQAGHYLISPEKDTATIYAYAVATHYKRNAVNGHTRTFVGSYDLKAEKTPRGWRLSQFKYDLKYMDGNTTLA
jgi:hypothetical protein